MLRNAEGRKLESQFGPKTFAGDWHEIISTVILPFPLFQKGQLSVTGESLCTRTG